MKQTELIGQVTATVLFGLIILTGDLAYADQSPIANFHPVLNISERQGDIRVDGDLSDPGWQQVAEATGFVEIDPGDNLDPAVQSKVLMTYDPSHLYVAFIAWDDPADIRVSLSDRDQIFKDDYMGILVDTYGDRAGGFEIFVNPLGIQGDLRILSDGNEDASLDLVFESEGMVTDSGYQVELAIPFASLRFPDKPEQTWRINLWRDRQRENRYRYSWTAQDRDNPCLICQYGTLTGLKNIKPGSNIELLPNLIAYQSGSMIDSDTPVSPFENSDAEAELSFTGRYNLSSNAMLEMTLNPDFSQVESDAGQIDVNRTFALDYPERRPFFEQGSDLYRSSIRLIHTRSINDPSVAGKFNGQFGRSSLVYLIARDDHTPLLIPLAEQSALPALEKSTVNILRGRRTFGQDSQLGFTLTDIRLDSFEHDGQATGNGSTTNYGVDGRVRLNDKILMTFQAVGSHTEEISAPHMIDTSVADGMAQAYFDRDRHTIALDGESFGGHAVSASLERSGRLWYANLNYSDFSPTFRTGSGFVSQNDYRLLNLYTSATFRPNGAWLVTWRPEIGLGRKFSHLGTININPDDFGEGSVDEWVRPGVQFEFKGQTRINLAFLASQERFSYHFFDAISRVFVNGSTRPSGSLEFGGNFEHGRSINRQRFREYILPLEDRASEADSVVSEGPDLGMITRLTAWASVKLGQRLRIDPTLSYEKMNHRDRYLESHPGDDRLIYSGYVLRTRFNYQFTREWFLRLVVQYDDFAAGLSLEPLLTYKINPYTVFYVGASGNGQRYDDGYEYENGGGQPDQTNGRIWRLSQSQLFAKFQYLVRL